MLKPSPTLPPTLTPIPTFTFAPASPTFTSTFLATITATVAITPTPQLSLADIEPRSATANTTVDMTIAGSGFMNGAIVTFESGQGVASEVTAVQVLNHTTMRVTINVRGDASFGTQVWDVRVINPGGATTILVDAFTVIP